MAVWPLSLVQQPIANGYEESYLESAVHSGMSVGRKNRLRDPAVMKTYNVKIPVDDEGKDVVFGFWSSTLHNGVDPFDWVKFDDGLTAHTYRMLNDPDITSATNGVWYVSLKLTDVSPQRVIDTSSTPTAASWPSEMPQGADANGWREVWNGYSLRGGVMPGKTARPRGSLTEKRLSLSTMITLAQKRVFEAWYEDELMLGTLPFTHNGWTTGASARYVMLTPPKFTGMGAQLFTLSTELVTI